MASIQPLALSTSSLSHLSPDQWRYRQRQAGNWSDRQREGENESDRQRERACQRVQSFQVHDVCDVWRSHGWRALSVMSGDVVQPFGVGLTADVGRVTPTFHEVFKPGKLRRVFLPSKRGKRKPRPKPREDLLLKKLQLKVAIRRNKPCCSQCCIQNASDDFLRQVAQWRHAWCLTPRCQKQSALMQYVRERSNAEVPKDMGTCVMGGRQQLLLQLPAGAKRCTSAWQFIGHSFCEAGFLFFSGISFNFLNSVRRQVNKGFCTYVVKKRNRPAPVRSQMFEAIWMVIQDLHHQSPYAGKCGPDQWHIPLHRKICLWRLVQKLHAEHEKDDAKPALFSKMPRYDEFRRVMLLPEFKDVIFHRMVDIGRCPRCLYIVEARLCPIGVARGMAGGSGKASPPPDLAKALLCCRPGQGSHPIPRRPTVYWDGLWQWA